MAVADVSNMPVRSITYSERYCDDTYEYRHVILPSEMVTLVPKTHLMSETEWRNIGIQQSTGWQHFMLHHPEPYVLLFRRPKPPTTTTSSSTETHEDDTNTESGNGEDISERTKSQSGENSKDA